MVRLIAGIVGRLASSSGAERNQKYKQNTRGNSQVALDTIGILFAVIIYNNPSINI